MDDFNNYQVSVDPLKYLLDPVGIVSALRAPVDGVGVGAVAERAAMESVLASSCVLKSAPSPSLNLRLVETSNHDYQAGFERSEGCKVRLLLEQFWGYWDHADVRIP